MPRFASSSATAADPPPSGGRTVREAYVDWLRHAKNSTGTPVKSTNTRLPTLPRGTRANLLKAVNDRADDPLVQMLDVHVELNTCYQDAITSIGAIYRSHDEDLKNLHKLVTNVWTIRNTTSAGEDGQRTLTHTNYEALKAEALRSVDKSMLKDSSETPISLKRYLQLLDQIMLKGACTLRACLRPRCGHFTHSLVRVCVRVRACMCMCV